MGEHIFSSHEVGALLQANPSTVIRWIDSGQLKAYRTPGGHRRVRQRDLLSFLRTYGMPIPSELLGKEAPRILLIDDDAKFLRALKRGLSKIFPEGEIETCTSGVEALIKMGTTKPDIVVLDVFMPEVDGVEVCRKIKANPATARIDVIAITGRPAPDVERKVRRAGARALLEKPFTAAQLAEVIRR